MLNQTRSLHLCCCTVLLGLCFSSVHTYGYIPKEAHSSLRNDGSKDSLLRSNPQELYFVPVNSTEANAFSFNFSNQTNQQFFEIDKVNEGDISYGDFDGDGDLDVLAVGLASGDRYSARVYRNDNGTFRQHTNNLEPIWLPSATWVDYDSDGDLDILLLGAKLNSTETDLEHFSGLYENHNGNFLNRGTSIQGAWGSSADWGDFDNDGDPDLVMSGFQRFSGGDQRVSKIYRNLGNGNFAEIPTPMNGIEFGEIAWYDVDLDGDLDVILTGSNPSGLYSEVYLNFQGQFSFSQAYSGTLRGLAGGNLSLGDVDRDGDLDLALMGQDENGRYETVIYGLNPGGGFVNRGELSSGFKDGDISFGDYNNDGFPDLIVSGQAQRALNANRGTELYNNQSGFFQRDNNCSSVFSQLEKSSLAWGDYDNDKRIDLIATGRTSGSQNTSPTTNLYKNQVFAQNNQPSAPTGLSELVNDNEVTLSWNRGNDIESGQLGLTYNIRVGTFPGGADVVSPMSLPDGTRQVVKHGNVQSNLSWTLKDLPDGTYYWCVQSIDGAYEGSAFSEKRSFTTGVVPLPDLVGEFSSTLPERICQGSTNNFSISLLLRNLGNANVNQNSTVRCYLSEDLVVGAGDDLVGQGSLGAIPVGASTLQNFNISLPGNKTYNPGTYFLICLLDVNNNLAESNEGNNTIIGQFDINNAISSLGVSVVQTPSCSRSGTVSLQIVGGQTPYEYSLNGGDWILLGSDNQVSNLEPDAYQLIVRDQDRCQAEESFNLSGATEIPRFSVSSTTSPSCTDPNSGSVSLEVTNPQDINPPYTYFLGQQVASSFGTQFTFRGLSSGSYEVYVQSGDECISTTQTVTLTNPDQPDASIAFPGDPIICQDESGRAPVVVQAGGTWEAFGPNGAFNYGGGIFSPNRIPGDYTLVYSILTDQGCFDADSATLSILLQPDIAVFPIDPTCEEQGLIDIEILNSDGNNQSFTYFLNSQLLSSTDFSARFTDLSGGNYIASVENGNRCRSNPVEVFLSEPLTIPISLEFPPSNSLRICQGDAIAQFAASVPGGTWSGNISSNGVFDSNSAAGNYEVSYSISSSDTCSEPINIQVEVLERPVLNLGQTRFELENGANWQLPLGQNDLWTLSLNNLDLSGLQLSGTGSINHSFNLTNAEQEGTAVYTITPSNGVCDGESETVEVLVFSDVLVEVSELLTPNGDGFNDELRIAGVSRRNFIFMVFNQLGAKVFESQDSNLAWDGGDLPEGAYWYILEIEGIEPVKGSILLKRT